ncbi:MAG: acyl-CoA dehydrogenase family protein [Planctomycetes bacterium]|nr:acyl-CoA dehydrogenase family protein [Planctomycetota bacterium]MCB9892542.1 acyl-CoA dehydrogenase family protein [Planctomycetota bacterium]MCB9919996.1 acyl-CoA dehydrogenase family protein [Planctomycetota bacterium]
MALLAGSPFFDDEARAFARRIAEWSAAHAIETHDESALDVDATCKSWVRELAKDGLLAPTVARPFDVTRLCIARETLAYLDGLADFSFAMQGLGSGTISLFGTDAMRDRYLPRVARGEAIAALALSESEAGSDVASLRTTARLVGDEYVLDGEKMWISNGGIADFYIVFARTGEAPGARGLSAFVVDAETPGLEIVERIDVIAPHPLARLRFRECKVPATALVGARGRGFHAAMATLDIFRSTVGAAALGFAKRAFDEAVAHTTTRELFGGPLSDMPVTRAKLADMALSIDASALLVYRAAWLKDRGQERVTREAAMAKLFATERAQDVIDAAVQLHGGHGVRVGSIVEKLYREIRALRIYEGATEIQQQIIGRTIVDDYRERVRSRDAMQTQPEDR